MRAFAGDRTTLGILAMTVVMVLGAAVAKAAPAELHVAPNGNDAWSGALAVPDATGGDGPLATLVGARDAVRRLKAGAQAPEGVRVIVHAGTYYVTEAVHFGREDSGADGAPITYAAAPGEESVIHGGRRITGWQQEGERWVADVPKDWRFGALWVNGERRTPARTPNAHHPAGDDPVDGELFYTQGPVMEKNAESGKEERSATRFYYRPGDLDAWPNLNDAVVVVYHSWETALMRPKSIDVEDRIIEFTGRTNWGFGYWRPDQRYFVEHLFEALDQPGEWFLNHREGKVYYIPFPGEDLATANVVAPVAKQLVLIEGKPAEGTFVDHLRFEGLRFEYADWPIEPSGHSDGQAAFSVPAAFEAVGARDCVIEDCVIGHVGTYGVWFRAGCKRNRLVHSEIVDLGAGGVRIGEGGSPASENEAAEYNVVDNCFLHDGGRIFRGAVGFWIGRSSYNTLSHCEVCDFRYSGLSIGWSWGYAETSAHHNIIEYNHVHHVGHGQLSDMGAIYTLGVSPGTVIRNNSFHDVMSCPMVSGGWGIYFDEGSTDIVAENNIVYNTLTGTLHQHYGKENQVRNNVFAFSHREQLIRSREEEHISFVFERNIVYFNNGRLLGSQWGNGNWKLDSNCYWDTSGEDMDFAGRTFEEWQAEGHDTHSIIANPGFENAEAGDFRLKPNSPALAVGFQPIDQSATGLYGESEWVDKPKQIPREPSSLPVLPEPVSIHDGFEETPVGNVASDAHTQGEEGSARIRVTDETAATGSYSLRFTDAPGLKFAFNPHLVYLPNLRSGRAVGRCALRVEPGAVLFHEWRDSRSPYRVGPSIWVQADGKLTVGGKELLSIRPSEWFTLEIECVLGKDATGTFNMKVALAGEEPRAFENLACGSKAFARLEWMGFVSNADAETVAYLDDVSLEVGEQQ